MGLARFLGVVQSHLKDLPGLCVASQLASGKPESGVKVIFTNQGGPFKDRTFQSDAQGNFDVPALPEGDWLVSVADASGKAVPYTSLTVSRGKVMDEDGREWATLTLNR